MPGDDVAFGDPGIELARGFDDIEDASALRLADEEGVLARCAEALVVRPRLQGLIIVEGLRDGHERTLLDDVMKDLPTLDVRQIK